METIYKIVAWMLYKTIQKSHTKRANSEFKIPKFLPSSDDISHRFFLFGKYEDEYILELKRRITERRGTFLDIGAHIGTYSVNLSERFDEVICFEPNPEIYECLALNVKSYDNVNALNFLLSNNTQDYNFAQELGNSGKSRIVCEKAPNTIEIRSHRLDDVLANYSGKIDLIKIDAEGSELRIVEGAKQTLQTHNPMILIEVLETEIIQGKSKVLMLLCDLGYTSFEYLECRPNVRKIFKNRWLARKVQIILFALEIIFIKNPQVKIKRLNPRNLEQRNYEAIICSRT